MINLGDKSKAITAEDLIRRYNLDGLSKDRKAITTLNDGLTKTNTNLENYVEVVTKDIQNLQDQVDGNITTWFFNGIPTLENQPANEWITENDKINHLGDLYYDQDTGYAYRWANIDNIYQWSKIVDADVVEALALANAAQDTADSKRRTFYDQPITPYDSGDIWIYKGEIYRCIRSREEGDWNTADWVNDLIYTDDTLANKALTDLENFTQEVRNEYVTNKVLEETENSISSTIQSVQIQVDKKSTTFREQPTTPYKEGDVWIQNEKIYVCINTKESGEFLINDWELNLDGGEFATKTQIEQTDKNVSIIAESQKQIEQDITTTKQASGNPIIVEDAGEYLLESIEIEGKSVQDGTPTPDAPVEIESVKGVRNLFDKSNANKLNAYFYAGETKFVTSSVSKIIYIPITGGKTYTISKIASERFNIATSSSQPVVGGTISINSNNINTSNVQGNKTKVTIETNNTDNYLAVWYYASNADTLTEQEILDSIMIEEGLISHKYVPYGRWLEQKTTGKNLFDGNIKIGNISTTTGIDSTSTLDGRYVTTNYINVKNKIAIQYKNNSTTSYQIVVYEYDKAKNFVQFQHQSFNKYAFELSSTTEYIRIRLMGIAGNTIDNYTDIMIENGELTDYEPYKENTALIDMNKPNLFDKDNIISGYNLESSTGKSYLATDRSYFDYIEIRPNTAYTIDGITIKTICYYNETKTFIGAASSTNIITTPVNSKYVRVSFDNTKDYNNPILFEGYSPYYELASIGDTKDVFNNGTLTQNIGKVVLDGSENFVKSNLAFQIQNVVFPNNIGIITDAYCNKYDFEYYASGITSNIKNYQFGWNYNKNLTIRDDNYSTASEFKAYLKEQYDAGTPVTIYYVLATPIEHTLNYDKLELHRGYNYITLNDELEPNMNIEYLVDSKLNLQYATKSELKITNDEIRTEVSKKVGENEVASVISQTADKIFIESNNFGWKSENSEMTTDGTISCKNANLIGNGKLSIYNTEYNEQTDMLIEEKVISSMNYSWSDETNGINKLTSAMVGKHFTIKSEDNETDAYIKEVSAETINVSNSMSSPKISLDECVTDNMYFSEGKGNELNLYGTSGHFNFTGYNLIPVQYITASSGDISVSNTTNKMLMSLNLEPGRFIIVSQFSFSANSNGLRKMNISGTAESGDANIQISASPSGVTRMRHVHILNNANDKVIYWNAHQTSGATLTCSVTAWIYRVQ